MYRPDWDTYYLGIAYAVSLRGDCIRRQVGAVLVKDNRIKATGYNGSPPGGPSCLAGECPRVSRNPVAGSGYEDCVAIHAEANALLYGGVTPGAVLYVTTEPCHECRRLAAGARVSRVVWPDGIWMPLEPMEA